MPSQVSTLSQPHRGLFTRSSSYYSSVYGNDSCFGPPSYSDDSDSALEDNTEVSESESEPELESESISQIPESPVKTVSRSKPKSKPKPKSIPKSPSSVNFLAEDCIYDTDEEDEYIIRSMTESLLSKSQHLNPALIAPTPSSPRPCRNVKKPNYKNTPTSSESDGEISEPISTSQIDPNLLELLTSEDESSLPDDLDVIELQYDIEPDESLSPAANLCDPDLDPRRRIEIPVKSKKVKPSAQKRNDRVLPIPAKSQVSSKVPKALSQPSQPQKVAPQHFCMICDKECFSNDKINHLSCKMCKLHFHKSCINVQSEITDYTCRPCRKEQKSKPVKKFKRSSLARKTDSVPPQSNPDPKPITSNHSLKKSPAIPKIKIKSIPTPAPKSISLDFSDTSDSDSDSAYTKRPRVRESSRNPKAQYPLCPPSSPDHSKVPQPSRAGKRPMKSNLSSLYTQPPSTPPRPAKRPINSILTESPSPIKQSQDHKLPKLCFSDSEDEIPIPPKFKTLTRPSSPSPTPSSGSRHSSKSLSRISSPIPSSSSQLRLNKVKSKSNQQKEKPKAMKKPKMHNVTPSASHPSKFSSQFKPNHSKPSNPPPKRHHTQSVVSSTTLKLSKPKPSTSSSLSTSSVIDEDDDVIIIDSEEDDDLDCCPICVGHCSC